MVDVCMSIVANYSLFPGIRSPIVRPYRDLLRRPNHEVVGCDWKFGMYAGVAADQVPAAEICYTGG